MASKAEKVGRVIKYYKEEITNLMTDLECLIEDFEDNHTIDREVEILNTAKKLKNRENIIEQLNKITK